MKKIFSVILSFVILISSMGFTVSSHECGGKIVETAIGIVDEDVTCGMEKNEGDCSSTSPVQMKSNCCQDEFHKVQNDNDYTQRLIKFDVSHNFAIIFVAVLNELLPTSSTRTIFYKDYSPPPLIRDIPVMVQSFLI